MDENPNFRIEGKIGTETCELIYDYDNLEAQQIAMALRVIEHKMMQDQAPVKPNDLANFIAAESTLYRERAVSLLVGRKNSDTGELIAFNPKTASGIYFDVLKSIKAKEVDKLDEIIEDFLTRRGKTSLVSLLESSEELRIMTPIAQKFMTQEQTNSLVRGNAQNSTAEKVA